MAKRMAKKTFEKYPRIETGVNLDLIDDAKLAQHASKVKPEDLQRLIVEAIRFANQKSSRTALNIADNATPSELDKKYKEAGEGLFEYFREFTSDPASTSLKFFNQNCREVAREHYQIRVLQKERMNSGWRYQYLATGCAKLTGRFEGFSDLGLTEADFNASIRITETNTILSIYVSVKNRASTIGGTDWNASIDKLEKFAIEDKNRTGPYLCVFAFVMDKGLRRRKRNRAGEVRSQNTELWASDYFWPFFANFKYEEIMQAVLQALLADSKLEEAAIDIPDEVLDVFEQQCRDRGLVDDDGNFNDPTKLVAFFCGYAPRKARARKTKPGKVEEPIESLLIPDPLDL